MNITLEAYGPPTLIANATASARNIAAEFFVDFTQFDTQIAFYLSALAQIAAAPTQSAIIEAWASTTEGDASGTGTLLGQLTVPAGGTGGVTIGIDGTMVIANPGGEKYVTFTTRAGLNGGAGVTLSFRGLLLSIDGPDGDTCNVATTPLIRLRKGAQLLSDSVNDLSIAQTTWDEWVNDGIESLWAMVTTFFADHFYASYSFALAGGIGGNILDVTTIPAGDFRRVRMLEFAPDTQQRRRVRGFNFNEKDEGAGMGQWVGIWAPDIRMRLMGQKIIIEPYERAAGNYRLYYVPRHPRLVGNCDALDPAIDQWAEYVKIFGAMKRLGVEESSQDPLALRLAGIAKEIAETAADRNDGQPDVIADTEDMSGWGGRGW